MRKLLELTAPLLSKRGENTVEYDYFDFHYHLKKGGGTTNTLDQYINEQVKNLYLNNIGVYQEKS
jgi:hypothetical protein